MSNERYLNHPTFGLLYRVAEAGEGRELYATLRKGSVGAKAMVRVAPVPAPALAPGQGG